MNVLVIGGTRFFRIPMVEKLLKDGHKVTLATRGNTDHIFKDRVSYIRVDRFNAESMKNAFSGMYFDVVIDKIAYASNDIKSALEVLSCERYIHMSSTAVYDPKRRNTCEKDYDPLSRELVWCAKGEKSYDEGKRQAEHALFQVYGQQKSVAVRYPYVIGKGDYTKRLLFYVEHTVKGIPMYIDNYEAQMGFIEGAEAGEFIAHLVNTEFSGAVNGCSAGTVSVKEIVEYVESKCAVKAVFSKDGDVAPYNGTPAYSINTDLAASLGYTFSNLKDWLYDLLDHYRAPLKIPPVLQ